MDLFLPEGNKVLITGAGGLIGRRLVRLLALHRGEKPIEILALVRNRERAQAAFSDLPQEHLHYLVCDVNELKPQDLGVGYIVHGAAKTASKDFVTEPAEVIMGNVCGTANVLEFARKNPVKGFVYLSTMEVYGTPQTDDEIVETSPTDIDTMSVRSSYPESKRLCESLCAAYALEHGVSAKVLRLTQSFGEGVDYRDARVFAEFARCAIEGRDIVLKTKGQTKRNYLDVDDAAEAILTVMLRGAAGEAYNAANEESYCSIYEMACMVAEKFGRGRIAVKIEEVENAEKLGYAKTLKMNLCARKLRALGWKPRVSLEESYKKMIDYMRGQAE